MNAPEKLIKSGKKIWYKWSIAVRILPVVTLVALLKVLSNHYGYEVMELNALFTSLVAGTIFLIGFLISGVLSDYKESEKIPGEMVSSLKNLYDDAAFIEKTKKSTSAAACMNYQKHLSVLLVDWLYKKVDTVHMLDEVSKMNSYFTDFESEGVQPAYIIRMKNEQSNLRKLIIRIDTIRETQFIGSAYAILEAMGFVIAIGLIILKIEPFYASLFFTLMVTFLITYMFVLIKDLDDPFDYAEKGESGNEISLAPIYHHIESLGIKIETAA